MRSKKVLWAILALCFAASIYFLKGIILGGALLAGGCDSEEVTNAVAPGNKFSARILKKKCGATTGYSLSLNLTSNQRKWKNECEVLTMPWTPNVTVQWISGDSLLVNRGLLDEYIKLDSCLGARVLFNP